MREVVTKSDIKKALGLKGLLGTCISSMAFKVCGFPGINKLFDSAADYQELEFTDHILETMNSTYKVEESQLDNIPKEGAFVVVSNHPFGAIEGLLLYDVIAKRRPDFKVMANFLLSNIPNLKNVFFPVNPFTENPEWKSSVGGIKGAIKHLEEGKGLGIFPAGEVSRYHGHDYPEDLPWSNSIARLIKNAQVPVIPIFWDGLNSRKFYRVDKIHSMLGTARLPKEILNKYNREFPLVIGKPILPTEIAQYEKPKELAAYLRSRSYALEALLPSDTIKNNDTYIEPVSPAKSVEELTAEIEKIQEKSYLFSASSYDCYLADYEDIPNLMYEIARLREEAFRHIGEGTGKGLDTDEYDTHYKHLILWHRERHQIAGAYRLGIGDELIESQGLKGFYISSLFRLDSAMEPTLRKTIELGRSFVSLDYQKEVLPLMLLLRGLSMVIVRYPQMEHFIGPTSISSWYPKFYQSLMVRYISTHHPADESLASLVHPSHPFKENFLKVDADVLLEKNVESVEKFDKFLFRLSNGYYRLPTLLKKYLRLNSKFLCFNVDPDFNDTLDGLLLLTFSDFPESEIMPLFHDCSEEEIQAIRKRFGY